jgi:glycosyltransferase involved in cell wall biosynthesis
VIEFPKGNGAPGHYLRSSYRYSCRIYDQMMKNPLPDFIYAKGFTGWKAVQERAAGRLKIPVGINFHGYEMFQPPPSFLGLMQQILLFRGPVKYISQNADAVFSYGGKINDIISAIGVAQKHRIEIPTGIEEAWLRTEPVEVNQVRKLVFLGRYERRKGIEELNSALAGLLKSKLRFDFQFIGPIPEAKQIKDSRITYHGAIRDNEKIRGILQSADFLVCPSHSEGMPNVIMEGMASGCAILATDVGAVSLMAGNDNGILISTDELSKLGKHLQSAIEADEKKVKLWRETSVQKVRNNFLWQQIAKRHLENFQNLIKKS